MKPLIASLVAAGTIALAPLAVAQSADDAIVSGQDGSELRSDWILGARIVTPDNEQIGPIQDIIINEEDGSVNAVIVSVGGFLGFGSKAIAVDWSRLDISYDANVVELDITREDAEQAEEYVYRDREFEPLPEPDDGGMGNGGGMGTGTGSGTGGGMGTGAGTGAGGVQ